MNRKDSWQIFSQIIEKARPRIENRYVPVALLCLETTENADGTIDAHPDGVPVLIWPKDIPTGERGPLLLRIAEAYQARQVLRSNENQELEP